MKKGILWLIGIVVVIVIIVLASKGSAPSQTGPIKIGFIGPLSGDAASYGVTEKNTIELALNEINSAGGINGRKVEVTYEDGKCAGKDATIAMQKLVSVDQVKIVLGGICSSETLAAAPIAEANHVLLFSAFSSNPQITNAGDYIFRNSPSDSDVGKLDANYIASHYKSVALISENSDYAQGVRTIMQQVFKDKGTIVTDDEVYGGTAGSVTVTDYRAIIQKIQAHGPGIIYINPTTGKAGGLIVKQIRQLGLKTPLAGNFSLGTADAVNVAGDYLNGTVVSDSSGLAQSGQTLLAAYKSAYNADPANAYEMGSSYDRVKILAQAIGAVGDNIDKIKQYLYDMTNYDGTIGSYHFDANGDLVGVGFKNFIMKGGKETELPN